MISWGMYAPGLHWFYTQFSRSQMKIFSMHTALAATDPNPYLQEMLGFLDIPATAQLAAASHANSATAEQKDALADEESLSCAVRDQLAQVYAPWNEVLFTMEPHLEPFPPVTDVPCREKAV
jgi:hypothetical protein